MTHKADDYHLGTSEEELLRLGYQHEVWQEVTHRLWALAGFGPGQKLLDLGAGPGYCTVELARLVGGSGRVEAVELAERFRQQLERRLAGEGVGNVRVHQADVRQLPLDDSSADGAFARWLLCFVEDPSTACAEVARVLRPGGVFLAWDYYNYDAVGVFPERPAIRRLFEAYYESARVNGGSYDIAQYLPGMLIECGLEVTHLEPINRVARPGSNTWAWVSGFHASYLHKLVEGGLLTTREAEDFRRAWREAEADPATFFFAPPMLGIVARKPGPEGQSR